jgi:uncharacterized protein (UPF0332 family)/predicted nucleotidyltransferase
MRNIPIARKKVVERFVREIKQALGSRILGAYLFGSTTKGTAGPESDMDVLIVYTEMAERELLETAAEISFEIACEHGQLIEVIPMSKEEYEQSLGRSPFLWEVVRFGIPLFTTLEGTEWELDFQAYLNLAQEFLGYAKDALAERKFRLAVDSGYNACELLVKALIISTEQPLASSHGGIVGQFGKLFVLSGKLDRRIGKNLNLSLELRAKARYKPDTKLDESDVETVIALAEELLRFAEQRLLHKDP